MRALRRLPLDLQITIELFYWQELPIADIAAVLEIPVGTVKSRVSRARHALMEEMGLSGSDDFGADAVTAGVMAMRLAA